LCHLDELSWRWASLEMVGSGGRKYCNLQSKTTNCQHRAVDRTQTRANQSQHLGCPQI
jgi:hypothetical protein